MKPQLIEFRIISHWYLSHTYPGVRGNEVGPTVKLTSSDKSYKYPSNSHKHVYFSRNYVIAQKEQQQQKVKITAKTKQKQK